MALTIKPNGLVGADHQLWHIWSLTEDMNKVQKRRVKFDVNNWDERKSKGQRLTPFGTVLFKDDPL